MKITHALFIDRSREGFVPKLCMIFDPPKGQEDQFQKKAQNRLGFEDIFEKWILVNCFYC